MNAASDGLLIVSCQEIPEGTRLVAACGARHGQEFVLAGKVVHCTSTVGGHKVGIHLRFEAS